jgi:copper chaperone CopZ
MMPLMNPVSLQARRSILLISVALVTLFAGCSSAKSASNDQNQAASIGSKAVVIPVDGLICVACAARVKETLTGIDGVTAVSVDLEHRSVRVQYVETKTSVEGLVTAINGLGYKAGKPTPAD